MDTYSAKDLMLSTRYPNEKTWTESRNKRRVYDINNKLIQYDWFEKPGRSAKKLVLAIFFHENGIPPSHQLRQKYISQIEETYKSMEKEFLPWVLLMPRIINLIKSYRDTFPITISKALSNEGFHEDAILFNLRSNEYYNIMEAWQIVSTCDFVEALGYIKTNRKNYFFNYFFEILSDKVISDSAKCSRFISRYNEALDSNIEGKLIQLVSRDLTRVICLDLRIRSLVNKVLPIVESTIKAELGYRCSQIAYLFNDIKTAEEIESLSQDDHTTQSEINQT